DLSLYDNKSWNDPKDFAKSVKAITLPQDVPSTSDRRLIELKNQVQRLMEAHLAPIQPTQVNKITSSCEIYSGPHIMENPKQAFVDYASSRTDEAGGDDGDVMLIEIVKKNDDSRKEEPEAEGLEKAYIDLNSPLNIRTRMMYNWIMRRKLDPRENTDRGVSNFTRRIKGMHVFVGNFTYATDFMIVEDISSIIDPRLSHVVLGKPFVEISNMTHDPPEGVVRNNEDKRRGVEYVMSKILGFYKECLELGPEYVTVMDDEEEVTKFLIKNKEEFFTVPGDGVKIKTRQHRVSSNVIFDDKKLGSS
ncbi:hypothetical protein Tco_0977437, partial [Tanacetum coccineum]